MDLHPLAIRNNRSGACGMRAGDHVRHALTGLTGIADEFLPDGDALVRWDDGSIGQPRWNLLQPIKDDA